MELDKDSSYFLELQTKTGWGRMLGSFARWCAPQPGQYILDVGTGPGLLPALFAKAGAAAFGADHDPEMLTAPLFPNLVSADAAILPFASGTFHLVTASNLLYLTPDPLPILAEMARVTQREGAICLLNPSEHMTYHAAAALADVRGLVGLARDTLLNYARRAEDNYRWSEADLASLFAEVGFQLAGTTLRMGDGLVRYAKGTK